MKGCRSDLNPGLWDVTTWPNQPPLITFRACFRLLTCSLQLHIFFSLLFLFLQHQVFLVKHYFYLQYESKSKSSVDENRAVHTIILNLVQRVNLFFINLLTENFYLKSTELILVKVFPQINHEYMLTLL